MERYIWINWIWDTAKELFTSMDRNANDRLIEGFILNI